MPPAYAETYLEDAMCNLGDMCVYAAVDCGLELNNLMEAFVRCGAAERFGYGNPRYVAGMSGVELARLVFAQSGTGPRIPPEPSFPINPGPQYWTGWVLAYYQWLRSERFEDLFADGLTASAIMDRYLLHEADLTTFVSVADRILATRRRARPPHLKTIRKNRGYTQEQLAEAAGVNIRVIQLYEQRRTDIGEGSARTILQLARALGCRMEDLIEPPLYA